MIMIDRIDQQANVRQATAASATTMTKPVKETAEAEQQSAASASGITLQFPTDRVEISEQGLASLAASATSSEEATAKAVTDAVAEATEEAENSTTNLTSLSEQQLEQLVKDGSISRAQADSELARRTGAVEE